MELQIIKKNLLRTVLLRNTDRLNNIQQTISSNKEALEAESKSSAGDKHETGRAMLQLEMEKAGQQYQEALRTKELVKKIDISALATQGCLGAVVEVGSIRYFLSSSIGEVILDGEKYFCVSPNSPIGKSLLGKKIGDAILFRGKKNKVTNVY